MTWAVKRQGQFDSAFFVSTFPSVIIDSEINLPLQVCRCYLRRVRGYFLPVLKESVVGLRIGLRFGIKRIDHAY